MTYIATQGQTPDGTIVQLPISGRAKGTSTVLAANGTWNSGWIGIDNYIGVATTLYSDQTGSYTLEYSEDGTNVGQMPAVTVQYTLVNQTRKGSFSPSAKFVRFTYTNGPTVQTKFVFNIDLNETQTQASAETLNAVGADTRMASWTKSRLETKDSGGGYDYIDRTGRSLNVNVTNQTTFDSTTLAKNTTLTDGTQKSQVTNFPATQPVSGSVAVSNFPASQVVTGTFYQATQPVSGTVTANQGTTPWVSRPDKSPTATTTTVSVAATATTVLAANTNRKGATIWAEGIIYLLLGTGASQTSYTIKMSTGSYYEVPFSYTGIITAVGSTVAVRVTELT